MFTTTDVYSAASLIGQELQLLIDEHGPQDMEPVMLRIIAVLEELERCVNLSTEMDSKISDLQEKHNVLKAERSEYVESRDAYTNVR